MHSKPSFTPSTSFFGRALAAAVIAFAGAARLPAEAVSDERPAPYRFAKTVLSKGEFYEPTEMAILPNLDVLIAQRRGEILHYDNAEGEIYRVGFLDVYSGSDVPGVNAEEGVLGLVADPDFARNGFVYIFYSPADKPANRLSRFVFKNRQLDMASEKIVLELFSQRDICCHTGGSLAFGPDRLLYLSTGDNSTPFDDADAEYVNEGFAPLNELPGKEQYDARRSSANTNDLRGKILRIRMLPDGTYEIPEGNLFPASDKTRPEIYTMGHRNPYRISIDRITGDVYWGDVGPDANYDKEARGPRGYDEMNRATEAGNFGWPLFVGNNYAYRDYDYATGESGPAFDASRPINDSVNNTGLHELPPARAPFIWYPYGESPEFPIAQTGGRNAMAGPVYHKEFYPEETRLPDYYDGKVVMSDWIRNWFIAVTFGADGEIASMEPFLEELEFSGAIDVEMGPDGRIYILEYGSGWFQKNADSGLARIDFIRGNLPPKIESLTVEKTSGKTPFSVEASVQASDHEGGPIAYTWRIGDVVAETREPRFATQLERAGAYQLTVVASDPEGASTASDPVDLYAGNEQPRVQIAIEGNQSFYFPGQPVRYKVTIDDDAALIPDNAFVSAKMERRPPDEELGHKVLSLAEEGKAVVGGSDCAACHNPDAPSIGPSYADIGKRYIDTAGAETRLSNSILNGSTGAWGHVAMPPHPSFSESELSKIVAYVLSNAPAGSTEPSLPLEGSIDPEALVETPRDRQFVLEARYTDAPSPELLPLSSAATVSLRPAALNRYGFDEDEGFSDDGTAFAYMLQDAQLSLENLDLRSIRAITLQHDQPVKGPLTVSARLDSPDGPEIGRATIQDEAEPRIAIEAPSDGARLRDLYLVFAFANEPAEEARLETVSLSE